MSTVTPFRRPPKADYKMPEEVQEVIKKAARKATALHWAAFGLQEVGSGIDHIWSTREAWLGNPAPALPALPWLLINNRSAEND